MSKPPSYVLDEQIGYVLRRVTQRHLALFSEAFPDLTAMQWAVLARLAQIGPLSQNLLGREIAMDAATIKGVVDRLAREGLVSTSADPHDRRRLTVALTPDGAQIYAAGVTAALQVSEKTLAPLGAEDRALLLALLARLA